jgi:heme-degrading monooxygenase HmoA
MEIVAVKHPALLLSVKFESPLSLEEVTNVIHSRIDQFRALPGLIQKYYLQDVATGEYSGLYFWDSAVSLEEFRNSELRQSIAAAYETVGEPRVEVFRLMLPLRD